MSDKTQFRCETKQNTEFQPGVKVLFNVKERYLWLWQDLTLAVCRHEFKTFQLEQNICKRFLSEHTFRVYLFQGLIKIQEQTVPPVSVHSMQAGFRWSKQNKTQSCFDWTSKAIYLQTYTGNNESFFIQCASYRDIFGLANRNTLSTFLKPAFLITIWFNVVIISTRIASILGAAFIYFFPK